MTAKPLTAYVAAGGCGSKLGPAELRSALEGLHAHPNANVLFGLGAGDDAGAYKLTDDIVLVQTTDFFTPIVDDPYDFGRIAAANALSDCFALGAKPITALNITCFPADLVELYLRDVLRGGADAMHEAGGVIIGGHTVKDTEPKYGLAVTGVVHPKELVTNRGAKPGDLVVLTKKIGTGIVTTARKRREEIEAKGQKLRVLDDDVFTEVVDSMKHLNRITSELLFRCGVTACTDVTGFGLLGHASNIARASDVTIELQYSSVPKFDGVEEAAVSGSSGGCSKNQSWMRPQSELSGEITPDRFAVLCDPQTSGGLLFTIPHARLAEFEDAHDRPVWVVGAVTEVSSAPLTVRR